MTSHSINYGIVGRMKMRFGFPFALTLSIFLISLLVLSTTLLTLLTAYAQEEFRQREFAENGDPQLADSHLKVEEVAGGLDTPTTMAFLGPNDILVLEKDKGTVQRVVNGKILGEPLLGRKCSELC